MRQHAEHRARRSEARIHIILKCDALGRADKSCARVLFLCMEPSLTGNQTLNESSRARSAERPAPTTTEAQLRIWCCPRYNPLFINIFVFMMKNSSTFVYFSSCSRPTLHLDSLHRSFNLACLLTLRLGHRESSSTINPFSWCQMADFWGAEDEEEDDEYAPSREVIQMCAFIAACVPW